MTATSIKTTIRELDSVNTKLTTQHVTGPARLQLLRRQAQLVDLRDAALLAVLQQRPGLLDVVRLVEHELVRPAEVPEPQEAADGRHQDRREPAPEHVGRAVAEQAGAHLLGRGHGGHRMQSARVFPPGFRAAPAGPRRRPDPAAHASCSLSHRWMSRGRLYRRT